MAKQTINLGAAPDDDTGDGLRVGGDKINDNFDELYAIQGEVLTADRTYFVRGDGNNANTGLVNNAGGAFRDIQYAVDIVAALKIGGYSVSIEVVTGSYTERLYLPPNTSLYNPPAIIGIGATQDDVILNATVSVAPGIANFYSVVAARGNWNLSAIKIDASDADDYCALLNIASSRLDASYLTFGNAAGGAGHIDMYSAESHFASGWGMKVNGAAAYYCWMSGGTFYSKAITFAVDPNYTDGLMVTALGDPSFITHRYPAFYGGSFTGPRFTFSGHTTVFTTTGNLNFFPGSAPGVVLPGGSGELPIVFYDGFSIGGGVHRITIKDGVAVPAAIVGLAQIIIDTADGDAKILYGDGSLRRIITEAG